MDRLTKWLAIGTIGGIIINGAYNSIREYITSKYSTEVKVDFNLYNSQNNFFMYADEKPQILTNDPSDSLEEKVKEPETTFNGNPVIIKPKHEQTRIIQ